MRKWLLLLFSLCLFGSAVVFAGPAINPEDIQTILPKDGIQAILDPSFEHAREVTWLADSDSVVGVSINGEARAYPVPILSDREIVNDTVGGVPIAVTWCPLCYTAIVYDRRIGDDVLTFGVSGKLHANSLIMYDHQTNSLWSHLLGEAVVGPKKGASIEPLESVFTTWKRWKQRHPHTKVLSTGRPLFFALRDEYESYYKSAQTGIIPVRHNDQRVYPKEFLLGVALDGRAYAYPFSALSQEGVVNDELEGIRVVVIFDRASATGVMFRRELDGRILSFTKPRVGGDAVLVVDNETGSVWDGLTGTAVKGELKGKQLRGIPVTPSFWFAWIDHYPDTKLYQAPESRN